LFNLYAETDSLNRVDYFGLGPNTLPASHATYGFTETLIGANAIVGVKGALAPARSRWSGRSTAAFLRFVLEAKQQSRPSAPSSPRPRPPGFQASSLLPALRRPSHRTRSLQRSGAPELPASVPAVWLLRATAPILSAASMPISATRSRCIALSGPGPRSSITRIAQPISATTVRTIVRGVRRGRTSRSRGRQRLNRIPLAPVPLCRYGESRGSITLRLFLSESIAKAGSAVPFYFSPTLGGSDIDGTAALASYPDYRFRGPDLLLIRGSFEHSLGKLPIGGIFTVDEGRSGCTATTSPSITSATLFRRLHGSCRRAAVVYFLFAWGGTKGITQSRT